MRASSVPAKYRSRAQGDAEFESFVREFTPTLLRGAYLLLRDVGHAEDAVQTTMLRTSQHWSRARSHPQAYSRQVLVNVCREHWRRRASRPSEVETTDQAIARAAEPLIDQLHDRAELDQALSDLNTAQREIVVLRFFFDLSVEDTARLLDLAPGTVKSATHRGLARLKAILAPANAKDSCAN